MPPPPHKISMPLNTLRPIITRLFFLPTHEGPHTETAPGPTSPDKAELKRATPQSRNDSHPSNTGPARQSMDQQSRRPDPAPRSGRIPTRDLFPFPHMRSSLLPKVVLLLGPFARRLSAP